MRKKDHRNKARAGNKRKQKGIPCASVLEPLADGSVVGNVFVVVQPSQKACLSSALCEPVPCS